MSAMAPRNSKLLAALNQDAPVVGDAPSRSRRRPSPETLYSYSEHVDLLPEAAELPDDVQDIARQLIITKRRIGRELLETGRLLAEARERTEHGQWLIFLRVTNTSPDVGEYLQMIWRRASSLPAFRDAIERGFLSEGVARRLARESVPNDAIDTILQLDEPPTVRLVEQKLRELRPVGLGEKRERPAGEIPTRVGISPAALPPHDAVDAAADTIGLLTDTDHATIEQLRQRIATYQGTTQQLREDDRQHLWLLLGDLHRLLGMHVEMERADA